MWDDEQENNTGDWNNWYDEDKPVNKEPTIKQLIKKSIKVKAKRGKLFCNLSKRTQSFDNKLGRMVTRTRYEILKDEYRLFKKGAEIKEINFSLPNCIFSCIAIT